MRKIFLILSLISFLPLSAAQEAAPMVYPVVILGGGIGGLTAAIYAGRAGMSPLVIEGPVPGGAIAQSPKVQNWPGEIEIAGTKLMENVHQQAEVTGSLFLNEEVVGVDFSSRPFTITTSDPYDSEKTQKIQAETCIIAMGSSPKFLGVPGENEESGYWLRGVYNCAVCDGPLYKDKVVAVVGGGDSALIETYFLSKIAKKVYVLVRKDTFRAFEEQRKREIMSRPNVEVRFNTTVEEIKGNGDFVTHLVIKDKNSAKTENLPVDALFLAIGSKPNTEVFQDQLDLADNGYIVVTDSVQTSVPGVFAIGDIADPIYRQAISAAADGMKAVYQIDKFLATEAAKPISLAALDSKTLVKDSQVIDIRSQEQFEKEIKRGTRPTLVDFYASWCGPCKKVSPVYDATSNTLGGKMTFLKVNVDNFPTLSQYYQVSSMPSMLIFNRQGNYMGRKVGGKVILNFLKSLDQVKNSSPDQIETFIQNQLPPLRE